ncbi:hypothetical protein TNCV_1394731 [Trichonephila clavipes]|nr:hypothetical protein TNCV_1394731 [Trichonephila clavipes]
MRYYKKLISPDFMTTCVSEKIVKESEDFEGRDSGWTLDEILTRSPHEPLFSFQRFIILHRGAEADR